MDSALNYSWILIAIIIFPLLSGCEKICDCAKSTGTIISEPRTLTAIDQIELNDNIDLIIHFNSTPKLKVTAGKNLISEVITNVDNGVLRIKNENDCNWVRDFNSTMIVEVWTPSIKKMLVEDSAGDIYFEDSLDCTPTFTFDSYSGTGHYHFLLKGSEAHLNVNNGPADITAKGIIDNLYVYTVGYGKTDCENLQATNVSTTNKSTNSQLINVKQKLDAQIFETGNIYFKGNPSTIVKKEYNKGKLISL